MNNSHVLMNNDGTLTLSSGQVIHNAHRVGACLGEHCPLHNPSEHKYRDLPLGFNGKHMYRVDGEKLYVDPDDYAFSQSHYAILRNSAKCLQCGDDIVSRYTHDFVQCSCKSIFVDGGNEYIRAGGDANVFLSTAVVVDES